MRIRYAFKEISNNKSEKAAKVNIDEINKCLDTIGKSIEEINKQLDAIEKELNNNK